MLKGELNLATLITKETGKQNISKTKPAENTIPKTEQKLKLKLENILRTTHWPITDEELHSGFSFGR